jgi:hypothetical protein
VRYRVKLSIPNSEKRLVVNGTPAARITQPPGLLPVLSRVYNTGPVTTAVENVFLRLIQSVPTPLPALAANIKQFAETTAGKMIMRNMAQYFDAANQVFVLPKGKWLLEVATTIFAGSSLATNVILEEVLAIAGYRPSTAQTITFDCTRATRKADAGVTASQYDTLTSSAIIETEDGDWVWPQYKYNTIFGTAPTGKITQSEDDPTYMTLTQLGI